jgi:hypothetical protein
MAVTRTKLQKNNPYVIFPPDILHDVICFTEDPSGPIRLSGLSLDRIRHKFACKQPPWQLMAMLFTIPHVSAVRHARTIYMSRLFSFT